tara:strand:- start:4210 stop:4692 length:483 start_codon:yes stop_codon:yes gene_type:complete
MSKSFVNNTNNQFIQARVASKEGVRCPSQRGGSYGSTMDSLNAAIDANVAKNIIIPVKHYNNCKIKQRGGRFDYDAVNALPSSYGFTKVGAANNSCFKGSYAPISRNPPQNQCGGRRRRKRKRRRTRKKNRKRRRSRRKRRKSRRKRRKSRRKSRRRKKR